jgi:predicted AAA+ superfamily ATPase
MKTISKDVIFSRLSTLNSHWSNGKIDNYFSGMKERRYIDLFFPLIEKKKVNRATILMGPRRVGKTVMIWHCVSRLISKGIDPRDIFYVSLDLPVLHTFSLEEVLDIFLELNPTKSLEGKYIFFDEIQYLKDWDVHLKTLVDQHKATTFIASGSAAGALSRQSHESGAGRFSDFLLPPLTFFEYLDLLGIYHELVVTAEYTDLQYAKKGFINNADKKFNFHTNNLEKLNQEFINYINYGGFPEALFHEDVRNNPDRYLRADIIEKVLLRDLPSLYGIQDTQELNRLFTTLVFQTGNEVTYDGISQASGVAKNTIKRYLEYLEAAFLIKTVRRVDETGQNFKRNNFFKVYVTNPSFYGALFGAINPDDSELLGHLVETAIFSQWFHTPDVMRNIYYARWQDGEVDMIYQGFKNQVAWAIEVKWSDLYYNDQNKLKKFYKFCSQNKLNSAVVTSKTITAEVVLPEGTLIEFKPAACYCLTVSTNLLNSKKVTLSADTENENLEK